MSEGLKKTLHIRNGYTSYVLRSITELSRTDEEDLLKFKKKHEKFLEEKVKNLKNQDDELLELIPKYKAETLTNEIDKSCQLYMKLTIYQ